MTDIHSIPASVPCNHCNQTFFASLSGQRDSDGRMPRIGLTRSTQVRQKRCAGNKGTYTPLPTTAIITVIRMWYVVSRLTAHMWPDMNLLMVSSVLAVNAPDRQQRFLPRFLRFDVGVCLALIGLYKGKTATLEIRMKKNSSERKRIEKNSTFANMGEKTLKVLTKSNMCAKMKA